MAATPTGWWNFHSDPSVTLTGSDITEVADLSGNGNTLNQTSTSLDATYVSHSSYGLKMADFADGSFGRYMSEKAGTPATEFQNMTDFTIILSAIAPDVVTASRDFCGNETFNTFGMMCRYLATDGTLIIRTNQSSAFTQYTTTMSSTAGDLEVIAFHKNGTASNTTTVYLNDSSETATLSDPVNSTKEFYLAWAGASGNMYKHEIGEMLVFDSAISSDDLTYYRNLLERRWRTPRIPGMIGGGVVPWRTG